MFLKVKFGATEHINLEKYSIFELSTTICNYWVTHDRKTGRINNISTKLPLKLEGPSLPLKVPLTRPWPLKIEG